MQKVNILGTEYEIIREAFEDETIDGFGLLFSFLKL